MCVTRITTRITTTIKTILKKTRNADFCCGRKDDKCKAKNKTDWIYDMKNENDRETIKLEKQRKKNEWTKKLEGKK